MVAQEQSLNNKAVLHKIYHTVQDQKYRLCKEHTDRGPYHQLAENSQRPNALKERTIWPQEYAGPDVLSATLSTVYTGG